ncbi:MAG: SDR family NAD(P)-dependent oxidoreductase [Burkholderiaceae bacterium]
MSNAAERFAIVTGGSAGIGAAIVEQMVEQGYTVLSLARRAPAVRNAAVIGVSVDLSDASATEQVAADLAQRYPVTTIVHNAGVIREKLLDDATQEDLSTLTQLHLGAPMALVQANLKTMREQHYGRILLMSTRAVLGLAKRTVYSTTKAGMLGMARTWALELAADGITCNVVCPGPIQDTEMFHEVIPKDSPKLDAIAQNVPVGRLGSPADVARAVVFFTAPESGFITGQTLFVCGGTSVGSITY